MILKECIRVSTLILIWMTISASGVSAEWQLFRESDGLARDQVTAILEDSSENLWFGTGGGVSRYDGVNWTTFTKADGLASDWVGAIVEDKSGNIWLAGNGISRYDGSEWTTYVETDGVSLWDMTAICLDSAGNLWFGSYSDGAFRFDGENWTNYTRTLDGLVDNQVNAIIEDDSGDMWFATGSGVSRFDGESWTTYTRHDGLIHDLVWTVFQDSSGDLWFGTFLGVNRYDGKNWTTYTDADGLMDNWVRSIAEDRWGNLWFGSGSGVSRFDGRGWRTYPQVVYTIVRAITEDGAGNLWFGTIGGVWRFDSESWTTYTLGGGWGENCVYAITEDSAGDLWFGTRSGVTRYDGASWKTFTEADGLAADGVSRIFEDSSGDLWFTTAFPFYPYSGGVTRYDGQDWVTYTTDEGLADDRVYSICEDNAGNLWFGTGGGVSRFDGTGWTTYTETDGLVDDEVWSMIVDKSGTLWCGTGNGVCSFDGLSWNTHTEPDGPAGKQTWVILEDSSGDIWFGTDEGATRYDGATWARYSEFIRAVISIHEDMLGNLWFGSMGYGLARYDGESWRWYTDVEGLSVATIESIYQASSGVYWFGTYLGLLEYETDRVPPQTVIWPKPSPVSPNTVQDIGFTAAFREGGSIEFSYSFDEAPWSEWSAARSWTASGLNDGNHIFKVKASDRDGNVDQTPAESRFEIDATPPSPILSHPAFGQAIKDSIEIVGTASDLRFRLYSLEIRLLGSEDWETLGIAAEQVVNGRLAVWNTLSYPDGDYELRLSVTDTLGLTGTYPVRVVVDNEAPWAYETTPAVIKSEEGGDVYTTDGGAHLYFPPNAFSTDSEVRVEELSIADVPDTLGGGATRALAGYEVSWTDSLLAKPATLELSYEGMEFDRDVGPGAYPDETTLAIYVMGQEAEWQKLGGTIDPEAKTISTSLTEPGQYSIYAGGQIAAVGKALSALSITPRVFSPSGGFASRQAAIGFNLGRPGPVTVKIYNRAGRLVSEVASGKQLNAGDNLVHWDGRGRDGGLVEDGVYLVTVEAMGQKQVMPLAVVR